MIKVVENPPTSYEINELKNLQSLFEYLGSQTEVLKDKLENPDSDEDMETEQVALTNSEIWNNPNNPNVTSFLWNLFDLK